MRFLFKTDYAQDIRLFQHGGQVFWYGLLAALLVAAPFAVGEYVLSQLQFICIYSIVGLGLMLLVGFTGQISLGHAAFLAIGCQGGGPLRVPAADLPGVIDRPTDLRGVAMGLVNRPGSGISVGSALSNTLKRPQLPSAKCDARPL